MRRILFYGQVRSDATIVQPHYTRTVRCHFIFMRNNQHCLSFFVQPFKHVENVRCCVGVEVACWFIREQNRRVVEQGAGDRNALFLAAGELIWPVIDSIAEPDTIKGFERPCASVLTAIPSRVERWKFNIHKRRRTRQQFKRLKDKADPLVTHAREFRGVHLVRSTTIESVRTVRGTVKTTDYVHERALPAAGRTHDGDHLALINFKINAIKRADGFNANTINLRNTRESNEHR